MTSIAITGATLIDGLGNDPCPNSVVLIEDDKIQAIGNSSTVTVPRDADIIDADGHFVLPGIIDAHVHSTYRARDMREHLLNTPSYNILRSTDILTQTLLCGVTTARDMGGADAGFRQAIEDGYICGPRLQVCLAMISQTGGHGDQWVPAGMRVRKRAWLPDPVADGVEGMRRKVREFLMAGADFIKICTGGGITSVTDSWDEPQFSIEEIRAAVDEAANKRRTVAAHAEGYLPIINALRGGVHSIEHGWFIDEECIDLMLKQGTWWVPTLALVPMSVEKRKQDSKWSQQQLGDEESKDADIFSRMQAQFPVWQEAVKRGVNVAMGTDQSHRLLVGENLVELEFMQRWLGMSPMQVLVSATSRAAECIGRRDIGSLEPGHLADVLLVRQDPLEDIAVLAEHANISLIMKGGKIYKNQLDRNGG